MRLVKPLARSERVKSPVGMPVERFLARHWQRRPLLVRQAFPGFHDPTTPSELAGLACEPEVESRLVLERGGRRPWQVIHGPQRAARLRGLPPTHWTLLVQELDRHLPAVAGLLDAFGFLPHWRVDDVMASFAPRYGSVGPHVDSYDVFLIQGRGRRRWRVDLGAAPDFREGLDLRILKRFRPTAEWVLETGDMLYLPPGVGHHGVALEDCLTYSVGFRAPSEPDVLLRFLELAVNGADPERRYADAGLSLPRHAGEIDAAALERLRAMAERATRRSLRSGFARQMGMLLTEPRNLAPEPSARRVDPLQIRNAVGAGCGLAHGQRSRLAFVRHGRGALLFVDGHAHELDARLAFAAPLLADRRTIPAEALRPHLGSRRFLALVAELIEAGALVLE